MRDERLTTETAQAAREGVGRFCPVGEEGDRRPRARDERSEGAVRITLAHHVDEIGRQRAGGALQIVAGDLGERTGAARAKRLQHTRVGLRSTATRADVDARAQPVELGVDRRRRQPVGTRREHPVEPSACESRCQFVTAPCADGGAAEHSERHVGAESRAETL